MRAVTNRQILTRAWVLPFYALIFPIGVFSLCGLSANDGVMEPPGHEFAVEGQVRYEVISPGGGTNIYQIDSFRVSVVGCQWLIEQRCLTNVFLGNPIEKNYPVFYSSDTTNFYQLSDVSAIPDKANRIKWAGMVASGAVPFAVDPKTMILWYSFASGCYFHEDNGSSLHPPYHLGGTTNYLGDFRIPSSWRLTDSQPALPAYIAFGVRSNTVSTTKAVMSKPTARCIYSVVDFLNSGNMVLPSRVIAEYFSALPSDRHQNFLNARVTIQVTNVAAQVNVASFRPEISDTVALSDLRPLSENIPIGVAVVNATNWPDKAASIGQAQRILAEQIHQSKRSPVFLAGMILLIVLPLAIFFLKREKGNASKTERTEKTRS